MEDSLKALRKAYEGEEAIKVYDAFRSHAAIHRKNRLLLTLLDDIRQANAEVQRAYRVPQFVWPAATAISRTFYCVLILARLHTMPPA